MSTHLQRVHAHEPEVAAILKLPKHSKQRRERFVEVLHEGDYHHNYGVLQSKSGTLIPKYRKAGRQYDDFVACQFCKGLYFRSLLSRHVHNCSMCSDQDRQFKWGECAKIGKCMLPTDKVQGSSFFQNVIGRMRDDDVKRIVVGDSLLVKLGERMYEKKDVEEHTSGNVSSRLRELGRLVQQVRETSDKKVLSMTAALDPAHFDVVIQSVRQLTNFDDSDHSFKKGTLALKVRELFCMK